MPSDKAHLTALLLQIRTGLSERNRIEMAKRREPADTRRLEDAKTIIEDGLIKLKAHIDALED